MNPDGTIDDYEAHDVTDEDLARQHEKRRESQKHRHSSHHHGEGGEHHHHHHRESEHHHHHRHSAPAEIGESPFAHQGASHNEDEANLPRNPRVVKRRGRGMGNAATRDEPINGFRDHLHAHAEVPGAAWNSLSSPRGRVDAAGAVASTPRGRSRRRRGSGRVDAAE